MTHPIISDLEARYTAKAYDKTKKVSDHDLNIIKKTLQLSPSSINSQPWQFIILASDEAKLRFQKTFANKYQFNEPHSLLASHLILFCYNPFYKRENYDQVVDQSIIDGRVLPSERESAYRSYPFVDLNTDKTGYNGQWTKLQTYLAMGNLIHTLARLKIDSTIMEGVDSELISQYFEKELDGYICDLALAIGYAYEKDDYNKHLPKSRLPLDKVIKTV